MKKLEYSDSQLIINHEVSQVGLFKLLDTLE